MRSVQVQFCTERASSKSFRFPLQTIRAAVTDLRSQVRRALKNCYIGFGPGHQVRTRQLGVQVNASE